MATKKKKASKFGAKAAFVRSVPRETSAKEVVALGKKKGVVLSENYVYAIRSSDGGAAKSKAKPGPKPGGKRKAKAGGMTSAELQLRNAIADLGLVKATEILESVTSMIRGR